MEKLPFQTSHFLPSCMVVLMMTISATMGVSKTLGDDFKAEYLCIENDALSSSIDSNKDSQIWDLSTAEIIGRTSAEFHCIGDSMVSMLRDGVNRRFATSEDHTYFLGEETRLFGFAGPDDLPWLLGDGSMDAECQIFNDARILQSYPLVDDGDSKSPLEKTFVSWIYSSACNPDIVITPGDTLRDVRHISTTANYGLYDNKSLRSESQRWYASDCDFPVVEQVKFSLLSDDGENVISEHTYLCPRELQPLQSLRKNIRSRTGSNATHSNAGMPSGYEQWAILSKLLVDRTGDGLIAEVDLSDGRLLVTPSAGVANAASWWLLCDISGRVYGYDDGSHECVRFDTTALPPGYYLVVGNIEGQSAMVYKFRNHK